MFGNLTFMQEDQLNRKYNMISPYGLLQREMIAVHFPQVSSWELTMAKLNSELDTKTLQLAEKEGRQRHVQSGRRALHRGTRVTGQPGTTNPPRGREQAGKP